ncbi:MAG: hypothetical protein KAY83_00885 [Agitococcus sp.]|nr:hypothetical protein [Agitococcus sp.]
MFVVPRFDFVHSVLLLSQCRQFGRAERKEEALWVDNWQEELVLEPSQLYKRLEKSSINLSAVELFSVLSWESDDWLTISASRVVKNLWRSVLNNTDLRQITLFRVLLANKQKWPGPDPLIRLLSLELERLIYDWPNKEQIKAIVCFIKEDKRGLAELAVRENKSLVDYVRKLNLLSRLAILDHALPYWVLAWAHLAPKKRRDFALAAPFERVLASMDFERCIETAKVILDDDMLTKKLANDEEWPLLEQWFARQNKDILWRSALTEKQRQCLGVWLNTAKFKDFRRWSKMIIDALPRLLSYEEAEYADRQANNLSRRTVFWQNFQNQFKQVRFLLPANTLEELKALDENLVVGSNIGILNSHDASCELGIFHIGDYCIVEFFRGRLTELRIFSAFEYLETLMTGEWSVASLRALPCEWLSDHGYCWQNEITFVLDKGFGIKADNPHHVMLGDDFWYSYRGKWCLELDKEKERKASLESWQRHLIGKSKYQWSTQRQQIQEWRNQL